MSAQARRIALAGSRRLPPQGAALAQRVAAVLAARGRRIALGCCTGADAAVLEAVASRAVPAAAVEVFSAFGPLGEGAGPVSAVASVLGAVDAGAAVTWWAGGGPEVPLKARLARRTRDVVAAAPGGLVLVLGSPRSRGSLNAAQLAADSGFPVLAFPVGFDAAELPPLGHGHWAPAGRSGLWALAWRWMQTE